MTAVRRGRAGFVAGAEALIFGLLILVLGTLVVLNAWTALDARFAVAGAARDAVRAAVMAPPDVDLDRVATDAAAAAYAAVGRDPGRLELTWLDGGQPPAQARCAEVRLQVRTQVDVIAIPRWLSRGGYAVVAEHGERIEPFRSGLEASVCDG